MVVRPQAEETDHLPWLNEFVIKIKTLINKNMFTPNTISRRLYKTRMQRIKDFLREPENREAIWIGIILGLALILFTSIYSTKVDKYVRSSMPIQNPTILSPNTESGLWLQNTIKQ